ncbi:NADH:flavin oxidoreductase / NADH oxidase family domain-containing protein [Ditylenchus destructor]|nr:NADH:flavin oxidoreductase / NADH oxidase family domain-containing protein [Ditylenchus destructor]
MPRESRTPPPLLPIKCKEKENGRMVSFESRPHPERICRKWTPNENSPSFLFFDVKQPGKGLVAASAPVLFSHRCSVFCLVWAWWAHAKKRGRGIGIKKLEMGKERQAETGIPTQGLMNMYQKFSHGGFGVLLTGNIIVDPHHLEMAGNMIIHHSVDGPLRRERFAGLAKAMKDVPNVLAIAQLGNAGRLTPENITAHPISASDPRALSLDEIKNQVIRDFVFAAKFCKEAGFDGVELHSAHGYLLAQFISPTTNERTDQYGGSLENRVRLNLEIYEAIRKEIPEESGFIIGIKMNSVEFQNKGLRSEEAVFMCKEYDRVGFDFIELSGGTVEKPAFQHMSDSTRAREAFFLEFAKEIKPAVKNAAVYLTGGFRTVPAMVKAIEDGITDAIGLGRPIGAELDLPAKILAGKVQSAKLNLMEDNYAVSNAICNVQMWQAQQTPYSENVDINDGLLDASDEKVVTEFRDAFMKFMENMESLLAKVNGRPLPFVTTLVEHLPAGFDIKAQGA